MKRSDEHLFGYALRGIVAGYDLEVISRCFEKAVKSRHGLEADIGLQTGTPTGFFFECSSTVSMALQESTHAPGRFMPPPKERRISAIASQKRPKHSDSRQPSECQRARFASIMDALA